MSHAHEHVSNTKRIWMVFGLLSVVTTVEVFLGIVRPEFLFMNNFLSMNLLNWVFIILTLYKAYYIVWAFMHMEGEKKQFTMVCSCYRNFPCIIFTFYTSGRSRLCFRGF